MKIFIGSLISIILLNCSSQKSPQIKIYTGINKNEVKPGSQLDLSVKTSLKDYSVSFYLNEKSIKPDHKFSNEPLGQYNIKAKIITGNKTFEKVSKINLLAGSPPKLYTYKLINTFPHDISAYTQGLEFDGDFLYESTGLNGKSTLRMIDYKNGEILNIKPLDKSFFGEGLTIFGTKIIQLTWKARKGFVYDKDSFRMLKSFNYEKSDEGWGLCNDGFTIYKSDGTQKIWKLNPYNFEEEGFIEVMTHKSALENLNELEWVDGKIYANTYQFKKDVGVIINPKNGAVEGVIDFSGLKEKVKQHSELNVLNGIAYHEKRKTFFITGKNWDKLFEVKIIPK